MFFIQNIAIIFYSINIVIKSTTRKDVVIMKDLKELNKVRIDLSDIEKFYNIKDYLLLYNLVNKLLEDNIIKPIKKSKTNGKYPTLYNRYSLVKKEEDDNTEYINEIKNELFIGFDITYYISHIEAYKSDREYVLGLSNYLKANRKSLSVPVSINERSFEIWGKEKFLKDGRGKTLLKNVGIILNDLNYYYTPEPFVCFSFSKNKDQRVLIIENKDTWYSIRKLMIEGVNNILGTNIDTVIYGSGKGIYNSLLEYNLIVEDYLKNPKEILYWGDIDYEGIKIYEGLKEKFKDMFTIHIFDTAYEKMVKKSMNISLPLSKEGQNKNISTVFLQELDENISRLIIKILESGLYIPQEIINYNDLKRRGD